MDEIDKKILHELQLDASRSISQLAKHLNLPRTTINNRIKKLKKHSVIKKIIAVVDPEKLGYHFTVLLHITLGVEKTTERDKIIESLKRMKGVVEVHTLTGRFDIMAKIRVEHMKKLADIIFDSKSGLVNTGKIAKTESMIVMDTSKENGILV